MIFVASRRTEEEQWTIHTKYKLTTFFFSSQRWNDEFVLIIEFELIIGILPIFCFEEEKNNLNSMLDVWIWRMTPTIKHFADYSKREVHISCLRALHCDCFDWILILRLKVMRFKLNACFPLSYGSYKFYGLSLYLSIRAY